MLDVGIDIAVHLLDFSQLTLGEALWGLDGHVLGPTSRPRPISSAMLHPKRFIWPMWGELSPLSEINLLFALTLNESMKRTGSVCVPWPTLDELASQSPQTAQPQTTSVTHLLYGSAWESLVSFSRLSSVSVLFCVLVILAFPSSVFAFSLSVSLLTHVERQTDCLIHNKEKEPRPFVFRLFDSLVAHSATSPPPPPPMAGSAAGIVFQPPLPAAPGGGGGSSSSSGGSAWGPHPTE